MKFEIERARNGQFFFRIRATNGKIVAQSEQYKSKRNATQTIVAIMRDIRDATIKDLTL